MPRRWATWQSLSCFAIYLVDIVCKNLFLFWQWMTWMTIVYSCFYGCLLCLWRLEPRKLQPHLVEVNGIQLNSTQILHKVHFPNDTDEVGTHSPGDCVIDITVNTGAGEPAILFLSFQVFEVTSTTRVRDLIQNIVKKLSLASAEGYSIFVKTHNKVCLKFL